jgi:hypothetical protein
MNLSDLSKLILAVGICISCVGISIQIMRLLSAFTENVKDFKNIIKNLNLLIEGFVEDQEIISRGMRSVVDMIDRIRGIVLAVSQKIIQPITAIFGFLTSINAAIEMIKKKYFTKRNK